jgi:DNA end-binding protein Ku
MAAAARPYWTGFLKLSLVTIGVRLYTATTEKERVRFHQIHEPSGERVKQQLIVPGIGPVERADIVKGYEYSKGQYVTVDPDDIKRLKLETTDTIDIVEFVDGKEIEPTYFDSPYYLVPDGSVAEEGYRVIREALRETGKIAVGQVVINGQERIIAIRPMGTGLLGNALRYQDEVRQPEQFFNTIAEEGADEDQLAIMEQIIKRKTKKFDASDFQDHYQTALRDLIHEKLAGRVPEEEEEERKPAQVINLMDALKRSLAEEDAPAEKTPKRAASRPSHTAANEAEEDAAPERKPAAARGKKATAPVNQRHLLLPVEGGRAKTPKAQPKPAPAPAAEEDAPKRRRKAS